ncbi:MAG TPA: SDR family NAD(P)-dependent oxidoreductase [Casimicrobiaceae bacterium]|jgi:NAD(P)-dependent dehydrogenase (short-subunit alcohol dehydrogenase family)
MTFANQTVLVTGAAGNLGRAVADAFFERGTNLVLIGRRLEDLTKAYGSANARRLLAPANLLDQVEVDAAVKSAIERFGRIDVLCNIAGGFQMGAPVHETPDELWQSMLDLNARSVITMARAVVPPMLAAASGKIVNVAAMVALAGKAGMGAYGASKSATIRLTETMAAELRDKGINVNCVMPSIIDTPQNRAAMPDADPGRWVTPAAVADVILFLASDAARAIHGAAVPVIGLS